MKLALILPKGRAYNESLGKLVESDGYMANTRIWSGISPGILVVAALTPPAYDIEVIDENIEEIDFGKKYDLVGITFMTQQATRAYQIADRFREQEIPVVLGGIHATLLPQEAREHADSVVVGEAEYSWPQLISDFENNCLKPLYVSERPVDLKDSPAPRYGLIKDKGYPIIWLQTTRGCPHDCYFCAASRVYDTKYRRKSIEQVVGELDLIISLFGRDVLIGFGDDNLFVSKQFTQELLEKLMPRNVHWMAQTDIALGEQEELLPLLRKSGCFMVLIGFESISEASLKNIDSRGWKHKKLKIYDRSIRAIQSNGIAVMGSFILGHEQDDKSSFDAVKKYIVDNNIMEFVITVLTPFPGTRLREMLEKENRILPTPWENYTLTDVNFIHEKLSKEELEEGLLEVHGYVASKENYFKRMDHFKEITKKIRREEARAAAGAESDKS